MRNEHVLVSLNVIGALREGQKLSSRNGVLTIDKSPSPIYRWFSGDNRKTTLIYVTNIIQEANKMGFRKEVLLASPGIEALKVTYAADAMIVARLDFILTEIEQYEKAQG
jgi:hypothetical protein